LIAAGELAMRGNLTDPSGAVFTNQAHVLRFEYQ